MGCYDFRFSAGHSVGEYSALVFAGALSLRDAALLLVRPVVTVACIVCLTTLSCSLFPQRQRGEAMSAAARACGEQTAMSALMPAVLPEIAAHCLRISKENNTTVEIANINSKEQVVISGTLKGVAAVEAAAVATKSARKCTRLNVSAPFHCSIMQPAAMFLAPTLRTTVFTASTIPVLSNVTTQPFGLDPASLLIDQVRCIQAYSASACMFSCIY